MPPHTKKIVLHIPNATELPSFYASSTPEDIVEALQIGAALFVTVKSKSTEREVQAIEEQKCAEIARIREMADVRLKEAEAEYERGKKEYVTKMEQLLETQKCTESTNRKDERDLVVKQFEGKIRVLQNELDSIQEKHHLLHERKMWLESSREKDIQGAEERTRLALQQVLEEKERSVQNARNELARANLQNERIAASFQDILHKQSEEFRNLKDSIQKKSQNVKSKGNEYEEWFRKQLLATYGVSEQCSLEDTAHRGVGHAGDFLMKWGEHTLLWEVKNYDRAVPESEIAKFKRDVTENANVSIGILLSRCTHITGKSSRGDFHLEFMEGRMLVYISNMETKGEEILQFLMILFRLYWKSGKVLEDDDTKVSQIRQIEKLFKEAEQAKIDWRLHKANMDATIRWANEWVETSTHSLKCLLNDVQGVVERVKDIPQGIFRDCVGDEKSQQIVQLVLSVARYEPQSDMTMNDLAEAYAKLRNIARDTAKVHIKSVLLDSVLEQTKGKPVKLRGLALKGG